ncbi:hypothetical protein HYU14_05060 [Candidatus Woesearchaeota archaeon]|nr:hypothetical protein [Candidatus Woesearchaeota archaeon]
MASAFSPGNITLFFGIVKNKDPMKMGSIGVSFAVSRGARAAAIKSQKAVIKVNGKNKHFPTVETALKMVSGRPLELSITTELPLGCGYGMSGACALASVLAANKELGLNKSRRELALIAHRAEVMHKTGLGSVTAEYLGGFLVRENKGSPLTAKKIRIQEKLLHYASFGTISTKKILSDAGKAVRINKACGDAFRSLHASGKPIRFASAFSVAKEFALAAGLLREKKIIALIAQIESRGGSASMNMLGKSIISTIPFPGSKSIAVSPKGAGEVPESLSEKLSHNCSR